MGPKFKIGDTVYNKNGLADAEMHARVGLVALPTVLTIFGVLTEECHGGTQYHYVVRLGKEAVKVNESELAAKDEWNIPEWVATIDKARKAFPSVANWEVE